MLDSINDEILDIMAKHTQLERDKITPETPLDSIGIDSLLMVEIIFDLEERFDISIPEPEVIEEKSSQFRTVADVVRVVKELIEEQQKTL